VVHQGEVAESLAHLVGTHVEGAVVRIGIPLGEDGSQGAIVEACLRVEGADEDEAAEEAQEEELGHGQGSHLLVHEGTQQDEGRRGPDDVGQGLAAHLALHKLEQARGVGAVAEVVAVPVLGHDQRCSIGQGVEQAE
jgi:hypothetical protein